MLGRGDRCVKSPNSFNLVDTMIGLHDCAHTALLACTPVDKCNHVRALQREWDNNQLSADADDSPAEPVLDPGRPKRPVLVSPRAVERRKISTPEGRAALIHSLAHIEFNAVNLALDALYRFRGLPHGFYADWVRVAADEACHFTLLRDHLQTLGFDYGSFTAHNGLWEMAVKTAHDPLVRMALVPRLLEARGLDAAPTLIAKLSTAGDTRAVDIMRTIQRDEIEHVGIGNHWYAYLCMRRGVDPLKTFRRLLREHGARLRAPFDVAARRQAGFSQAEIDLFEQLAHADEVGVRLSEDG
jgi:uncharacterized ferritin-like protein (DUF455 family)